MSAVRRRGLAPGAEPLGSGVETTTIIASGEAVIRLKAAVSGVDAHHTSTTDDTPAEQCVDETPALPPFGCVECRTRWIKGIQPPGVFTKCDIQAMTHVNVNATDTSGCDLLQAVRHCSGSAARTKVIFTAHNKVYDVTNFLDVHPGGRDCLIKRCSQDTSVDFDFHSPGAQKGWHQYCIGKLKGCAAHSTNASCVIM
jgi:hypothetical protein